MTASQAIYAIGMKNWQQFSTSYAETLPTKDTPANQRNIRAIAHDYGAKEYPTGTYGDDQQALEWSTSTIGTAITASLLQPTTSRRTRTHPRIRQDPTVRLSRGGLLYTRLSLPMTRDVNLRRPMALTLLLLY